METRDGHTMPRARLSAVARRRAASLELKRRPTPPSPRKPTLAEQCDAARAADGDVFIACGSARMSFRSLLLLRVCFDECDVDGDGLLDPDELSKAFFHGDSTPGGGKRADDDRATTERAVVFARADRPTRLSFADVLRCVHPRLTRASSAALAAAIAPPTTREETACDEAEEAKVDQFFALVDEDGSGEMDVHEFRCCARAFISLSVRFVFTRWFRLSTFDRDVFQRSPMNFVSSFQIASRRT
jgi:hypothetical protein